MTHRMSSFSLDISFHTTYMVPLSDMCKYKLSGKDTYIRSITLRSKLEDATIMCTFEYDLSSLPIAPLNIGKDPVELPIPINLRHIRKGHKWVYLKIDAVGESVKKPSESPLEFTISVCLEPSSDSPCEKN
jgi:hypothetical protein